MNAKNSQLKIYTNNLLMVLIYVQYDELTEITKQTVKRNYWS